MVPPTLEEQFKAAVEIVQNLPKQGPIKPSISDQLNMYSLFKQATIGKCNVPQPAFYHPIDRMKWNAWNELGNLSSTDAMSQYVDRMMEMCDQAEEEHDFLQYLNETNDVNVTALEPMMRKNFAILGRTSFKGHEGETITIQGNTYQT